MCIPHNTFGTKSSSYKREKPKKSVKMVSKARFEHGDPDFVDERKKTDTADKTDKEVENKGFFSFLFD